MGVPAWTNGAEGEEGLDLHANKYLELLINVRSLTPD